MSADNGVFILRTKRQDGSPEFRVAYTQAIDNIYGDYNSENDNWVGNPKAILETFGKSGIHLDLDSVYSVANELAEGYEFLEYGVCLLDAFEDRTFKELTEPKE